MRLAWQRAKVHLDIRRWSCHWFVMTGIPYLSCGGRLTIATMGEMGHLHVTVCKDSGLREVVR